MIVSFNRFVEKRILESLCDDERGIYFGEKGGARDEERFPVYGVFFVGEKILYLICKNRNVNLFTIHNSLFYKIEDSTASKYWNCVFNCCSNTMRYPGVEFRNFNYIGIRKFVEERDFFEQYHTDNADAVTYMKEMMKLIDGESA